MARVARVVKVWIEEGCIVCDACESACADVFQVTEDTCLVRPEALDVEFTKPRTTDIIDAAEECPVDVIKFETVEEEVTETAGEVAVEEASVPNSPTAAPESNSAAGAAAEAAAEPAVVSAAKGSADPAVRALLEAATSRGGHAGIHRGAEDTPAAVAAWRSKKPEDLPPDARHARVVAAASKSAKDPSAGRRDFVSKAALTVGWVAFGTGTGVAVGPAMGRFLMPNVLEEPDPRIRVGKLARYAEMQPGEVNEDYKPQGIWMVREEGRVAALNIICTHLGCIPNWLPNDRKFKCPCHGSGYRPDGINFEGPTPRPLERFRIEIKDGIVVVDKSKKYQFELGQWNMPGSFLEV